MEWLYPDEYKSTIHDVDYDKLYLEGYRGVMFDIDNTLAPYDRAHPDTEVIKLFTHLKKLGFGICLVSNNNHKRVYRFNEKLKVHAYPKANKPFTMNLRKAMEKMGTTPNQTVLVGDQLFTDVWAGNQLKFKTILVKPIQDKEQWITKIKRGLENLVLKRYLKVKGLQRP